MELKAPMVIPRGKFAYIYIYTVKVELVESVRLAFNASSATFPTTTSPTWAEPPHTGRPVKLVGISLRSFTPNLALSPFADGAPSRLPLRVSWGTLRGRVRRRPLKVPATRFAAAFEALTDQSGAIRADDSDTSPSSDTASD